MTGTVTGWSECKASGYITCSRGQVFVTHDDLTGVKGMRLAEGEKVEFDIGTIDGRLRAQNVRPVRAAE